MLVGIENSSVTLENSLVAPQTINCGFTVWPRDCTVFIYPNEMKTCAQTKTWTRMFIATLFIRQKVETTQLFIDWWMEKQNVEYANKWKLFGHKNEWNAGTCYNMINL
jgi:hypothetical protein